MPRAHSQTAARAQTHRSASQATRRVSGRSAARPSTVRAPSRLSRVRWDRKFRALLIGVLLLVGWIGLQGAVSLVRTHEQAEHELQMVSSLVRENRQLADQASSLHDPQTIVRDARALGMVRANEQPFVVTGLPGN